MAEKRTRIYEIKGIAQADNLEWGPYLVEATSQAAAFRFMAKKYVGAVSLPNGKRIAELMHADVEVEVAGK